MMFHLDWVDDKTCVLHGCLTRHTVTECLQACVKAMRPRDSILFDLNALKRCDSTAIAMLLVLLASQAKLVCQVRFKPLPENLQAIVSVSELESVFEEYISRGY